jgi:predicted O-linked N-acetylglucosamine transferase (SPINDLY family)
MPNGAREALALDPTLADAHNNLGQVLSARGQYAQAAVSYRQAVSLSPKMALFHFNLGTALQRDTESLSQAEASFRRALELAPAFQEARIGLAMLLVEQGRLSEAENLIAAAGRLSTDDVKAMNVSGLIAMRRKDHERASASFRRAIELDGNFAGAWCNLGIALEELKDTQGAVEAYQQALALDASAAGVKRNLLKLYEQMEQYALAYPLAVEFLDVPDLPPALFSPMISTFQQLCDFDRQDRAWSRFRVWLELNRPEPGILEPLLLLLNYPDSLAEDFIFSVHKRWGESTEQGVKNRLSPVPASEHRAAAGGKLRIGYLSPDLRRHSVGYFVQHVTTNHDHNQIEVYCYSNAPAAAEDDVTERIRAHSTGFRRIHELDDATVAGAIAGDAIDILVDLSGHTRHNRIPVLALRPAPVQIGYLGYPNTSGAGYMDYWLSDPYAHADGDELHTEQLLRLPECFLCFGGFEPRPSTDVPPFATTGYITFGSFNNPSKISRSTVRLWAEILRCVPLSRLLLKYRGLDASQARANLVKAFEAQGIAAERLALEGHTAERGGHLDRYAAVDIALDTLPYNGTTTTCDALWMGVPVLTLAGKTHRQRVSYSILKNLGHEELVAWSEDDLVQRAAELAGQPERLADYRRTLRDRLRQSILCDPARFTRQLEEACRRVWRERTGRQPA